jgi:integrase/recombinase XerD
LFGLIAATGLRIHEAIMLNDCDVDTAGAVLLIKRGKNGRSRLVPVTACTAGRLEAYRNERSRILGSSPEPFFLLESGLRPTDCAARYAFARICQNTGLRDRTRFHRHGRGPRIHDLRHTFAVRAILNWYHQGLNPDREMFHLSTYLGHTRPEHTYWYIEAVPELLQLAGRRAEQALTERGGAP